MADEQIIIEVVVDNSAARKALTAQTKAVDDLKNANKEILAVNKELNKDYKANSNEINRNNAQIAQNNVELNKQKQAQKASAQQIKSTNNSLNAQKAALAANKRAIGDVNTATKQGKKDYASLEKEIVKQTKSLKKAEEAQGTFTRSVGDYGGALSSVNPAMGGAVSGFQAMTKGALAFIATPIGAIIAALGLAIGALTEYFQGSEEGQNELLKITNKLSAAFGVVSDVIQGAGKAIFEAITSPKETLIELGNIIQDQVINRIKAFGLAGKAIVKIFSGEVKEGFKELGEASLQYVTGVEDVIGKTEELIDSTGKFFDEVAQKTEDNFKRATEISNRQILLAKEERRVLVENANLDVEIAKNRLAAKKEDEFTAEQRIAFLKEAQRLEDQFANNEIGNAKLRLEIKQRENAQGKSNKEDKLEEAQLEANLIRLEESRANSRRKVESEIQTNIKKRDAAVKLSEKIELDRIKTISDAEFELMLLKKTAAAAEVEDAQEKADKLIEIERLKTARLLENKKLEEAERNVIIEEGLQAEGEIRKEASNKNEEEVDKAKELDKDKAVARVDLASQSFAAVSQFAEEGSVAAKAAAIGQATVNTYQAITNSLANVPAPFNIASAALTGALGFAQVANIAGIFEDGGITKFANGGLMDGGVFEGASHANGGVKFSVGGKINEAEGGEAIISKRATSMFKPQLSAMNVAGGGKKFANGGIPLAASSTSSIDSAIFGENSVANQLSNQVPVQVAVTDINRTQSNVSVKQVRSSI